MTCAPNVSRNAVWVPASIRPRPVELQSLRERQVGRTSLDVVRDLVPRHSGRAQLDPVVHVCVDGLGLAVELEQGRNTEVPQIQDAATYGDRSGLTIAPQFVSCAAGQRHDAASEGANTYLS